MCLYLRVFSTAVTAGPSVPSCSWAYTLILYCVLGFRLLKQCLLVPPLSFVSCFWPSAGKRREITSLSSWSGWWPVHLSPCFHTRPLIKNRSLSVYWFCSASAVRQTEDEHLQIEKFTNVHNSSLWVDQTPQADGVKRPLEDRRANVLSDWWRAHYLLTKTTHNWESLRWPSMKKDGGSWLTYNTEQWRTLSVLFSLFSFRMRGFKLLTVRLLFCFFVSSSVCVSASAKTE